MPLPKPKKYERRRTFIRRCLSNKEIKKYPRKQGLAICFDLWRQR